MKKPTSKRIRVLAIAPSSRGFGFAVMDAKNILIEWGTKRVKGNKNAQSLSRVADLIDHYRPNAIALEDTRPKNSRRAPRIHLLIEEIAGMAKDEKIKVKRFSRKQTNLEILSEENGTKHALAELLADRYSDELGFRLPPKRKAWMSEDDRMDIFIAVALAEHLLRSVESETRPS